MKCQQEQQRGGQYGVAALGKEAGILPGTQFWLELVVPDGLQHQDRPRCCFPDGQAKHTFSFPPAPILLPSTHHLQRLSMLKGCACCAQQVLSLTPSAKAELGDQEVFFHEFLRGTSWLFCGSSPHLLFFAMVIQ